MKAMIFAAGLGTRLHPLTLNIPKALVEINGVTLLEINIRRLIKLFGVTEIIVNTHHFSEKIEQFLKEKNNFGIRIEISREIEKPLETGGGLKKAAWFFDDGKPFFICNADILSTIDLNEMLVAHIKSEAMVTYAVQKRNTSRYMLHDQTMRMCGWMNVKEKKAIIDFGFQISDFGINKQFAQSETLLRNSESEIRNPKSLDMYSFSCFHVVNPEIFSTFPLEDYFTIIDWYLRICGAHKIIGFNHIGDNWCDIGTPATLEAAKEMAETFMV